MSCEDKLERLLRKICAKKDTLVDGRKHWHKMGVHDFDKMYDDAIGLIEEIEQDTVTILCEKEGEF